MAPPERRSRRLKSLRFQAFCFFGRGSGELARRRLIPIATSRSRIYRCVVAAGREAALHGEVRRTCARPTCGAGFRFDACDGDTDLPAWVIGARSPYSLPISTEVQAAAHRFRLFLYSLRSAPHSPSSSCRNGCAAARSRLRWDSVAGMMIYPPWPSPRSGLSFELRAWAWFGAGGGR